MIMPTSRDDRKHAGGFIVVAALWITLALATFASIYAVYINNTKQAFSQNDDRIQAEAVISSSLALTAQHLLSRDKQNSSSRGYFNFRLGKANVAVDFVSEATRIDLNAAPKILLAGLLFALGASNEEADAYADRIVEWRTPRRELNDYEGLSLYREAGLPYGPRQAPFASISELWLVRDLPRNLADRVISYVTVFSGKPGIDLLDAAPTVLAALPGMTSGQVRAIVEQRLLAPQNERAVQALLSQSQMQFVSTEGTVIRTTVRINFDNGRKVGAEAVIKLTDSSEVPYRILYWRDDLDGDDLRAGALQ
jgi:general secretion pathway protein K